MKRGAAFAAAALAWWLALLAIFIPLPLTAPIAPERSEVFQGSEFAAVMGRGSAGDGTLAITGFDPAQGALQVLAMEGVEAADMPVLRYAFEDFPRTLELVLVFRQQGAEDVGALTIPVARSGRGAVDLSRVKGWTGRVVEIGFAQYPVAQSVSPATAFQPFALVEARLEPVSWSGALAVRMTDWFGARQWQLLSLSALGPDGAVRSGRSLVLMMVLGVGGMIVLTAWIRRWRGRRLAQWAAGMVVLTWLLLDLRWLIELHDRIAGTRAVYAALAPDVRQAVVPDQALSDAANSLREHLAAEASGARVLVDAGSDYERARLIYHLLPLNVAPLWLSPDADVAGSLVVLHAAPEHVYDAAAGVLHIGPRALPAAEVLSEGALRVYRLMEARP